MTEKEIVTLNKKQLDFLIHCIAIGMSMTHRYPLNKSYEVESYIQSTLKRLGDNNDCNRTS